MRAYRCIAVLCLLLTARLALAADSLSIVSEAIMQPGEFMPLRACVENLPNRNKIVWTSSDESVATVDGEGLVYAKDEGMVSITAVLADGSNQKSRCQVEVKKQDWLSEYDPNANVVMKVFATTTEKELTIFTSRWGPANATMFIDGVRQPYFQSSYKFDKTGIHTIVYRDIFSDMNDLNGQDGTAIMTMVGFPAGNGVKGSGCSYCNRLYVYAPHAPKLDYPLPVIGDKVSDKRLYVYEGATDYDNKWSWIIDSLGFTKTYITGDNLKVAALENNYKDLTMRPGDMMQLSTYICPSNAANQTLEWKSGNPNIATVSRNGLVKASRLNTGYVRITASTTDGSDLQTNIDLTVKDEVKPVKVSLIKLDKTQVDLAVGSSMRLLATVYPSNAANKAISWASDNPGVASIDKNGWVKTLSEGEAAITATASDSSGTTAVCKVRVAQPQRATSMSISPDTAMLKPNEGLQLEAMVVPPTLSEKKVAWSVANHDVALITADGFLLAVDTGTTVVTARLLDGSGISAQGVVVVKSVTSGISQLILTPKDTEGLYRLDGVKATEGSGAGVYILVKGGKRRKIIVRPGKHGNIPTE